MYKINRVGKLNMITRRVKYVSDSISLYKTLIKTADNELQILIFKMKTNIFQWLSNQITQKLNTSIAKVMENVYPQCHKTPSNLDLVAVPNVLEGFF